MRADLVGFLGSILEAMRRARAAADGRGRNQSLLLFRCVYRVSLPGFAGPWARLGAAYFEGVCGVFLVDTVIPCLAL